MERNKTFIYSIKIRLFIYERASIEKQDESQEYNFRETDKIFNISLSNLKFIDMAVSQGIKKIIATPHNMPNLRPEEIVEKINVLNTKLKEENIECDIYTGQEIFYSKETLEF